MTQPNPPLAFWMGGEDFSDAISMVTLVFGADAVDDGNFPGYAVPSGVAGPDDDSDSVETVPPTQMFTANADKPNSISDGPVRQCAASGHWGAKHAMVVVDGLWYLRDFAPEPRSAKRYPQTGNKRT